MEKAFLFLLPAIRFSAALTPSYQHRERKCRQSYTAAATVAVAVAVHAVVVAVRAAAAARANVAAGALRAHFAAGLLAAAARAAFAAAAAVDVAVVVVVAAAFALFVFLTNDALYAAGPIAIAVIEKHKTPPFVYVCNRRITVVSLVQCIHGRARALQY